MFFFFNELKQRTLSFYLSKNNNEKRNDQRTGWTYVFLIIQHQFHLDGCIISNSSWFMEHHSFVSFYCNQGSFYLPIFSPYLPHKTYSSFQIHFLFIFFQSELLVPAHIPYSSHIYIYFIALHILQSGLLVPASIPWSSCCLSFLLYKHCEYPKISDTGVATFFFTKSLFPLYVQYIFIYLYIFENKGTSLFLTSTVSLHQLVVRNSLTHYCCWAFIDLTLAVEYDISKLLNIFDDVKFIRNRRKKGI